MSRPTYSHGVTLAFADSPYLRQDLLQRDLVEHAISVQRNINTMSAIEFLKSHDIDPTVIERVLLEPNRRRSMVNLESPAEINLK